MYLPFIFTIIRKPYTHTLKTKFRVFDVNEGGTYSDHRAVKGYRCKKQSSTLRRPDDRPARLHFYDLATGARCTTVLHAAGPKQGTTLNPKITAHDTRQNTGPVLPKCHCSFVNCDTSLSGECVPMFWKNILPPS
jgi:hypothetical protein